MPSPPDRLIILRDAFIESASGLDPLFEKRKELSSLFKRKVKNEEDKLSGLKSFVEEARSMQESMTQILERPSMPFDLKGLELIQSIRLLELAQRERNELRSFFTKFGLELLTYYSTRATWLSLQEKSDSILVSGLIALSLHFPDHYDYRDVMISLAPFHYSACILHIPTQELFEEGAQFAGEGVAQTMRKSGLTKEMHLSSFGWRLIETEAGTRYRYG